jgi:hypothetical protein
MDHAGGIKISSQRGVFLIFENDPAGGASDYKERYPGVSRPAKGNSQAMENSEHNAAAEAGYY